MGKFRFLNVAILSALVGSAALVYAQDDKPQDDKPARQEDAKPQPKPDEAKPPKQQEDKKDDKRLQDQTREQAMPDRQDHPEQGHPGQQAHATPAGRGGHIPDDKFRAHFGQAHHFTATGVIVAGQPQFQYSGYTFEFIDAWPVGWAYTDSCYIDYIDGEYFLFDLLHPGVQVALFVVL